MWVCVAIPLGGLVALSMGMQWWPIAALGVAGMIVLLIVTKRLRDRELGDEALDAAEQWDKDQLENGS